MRLYEISLFFISNQKTIYDFLLSFILVGYQHYDYYYIMILWFIQIHEWEGRGVTVNVKFKIEDNAGLFLSTIRTSRCMHLPSSLGTLYA